MQSILYVLICVIILFTITSIYLYVIGKVDLNKIITCKNKKDFCGIKLIDLSLSNEFINKLLELSDMSSLRKRVNIGDSKAGETIPCNVLLKQIPYIQSWYNNLCMDISEIIGEKVYTTPTTNPTTMSLLVYNQKGDHISWHYDINFYKGRFFTLLIPITNEDTCTNYEYMDENQQKRVQPVKLGQAILFEGDKVFHRASKLCDGEKRVILSLQFVTNPCISIVNKILLRIKDIAYIGT